MGFKGGRKGDSGLHHRGGCTTACVYSDSSLHFPVCELHFNKTAFHGTREQWDLDKAGGGWSPNQVDEIRGSFMRKHFCTGP